jgi:hypothetical protein
VFDERRVGLLAAKHVELAQPGQCGDDRIIDAGSLDGAGVERQSFDVLLRIHVHWLGRWPLAFRRNWLLR